MLVQVRERVTPENVREFLMEPNRGHFAVVRGSTPEIGVPQKRFARDVPVARVLELLAEAPVLDVVGTQLI